MRVPTPPPPLPPFDSPETPNVLGAMMQLQADASDWLRRANDAYWSWDDMRRRPLPVDLPAQVAWWGLTLLRRVNFRRVPLLDIGDEPFGLCMTDSLLRSILRVQAAATDDFGLRPQGALPFEKEVRRSSIIEEAIHSSLIEGAATTRHDARRMIEEERPARDASERMILNNYRTVEMLTDLADEPLTPALIMAIHRSLTEGTLPDSDVGRFQAPGEQRVFIEDDEGNVLFGPPPAEDLPERIDRLCEFANDDTGPWLPDAVRAAVLHFQFAYEHPFVDGNGRTARALFYWYMLRKKHAFVRYLSISRIILASRAQYARAFLDVEQTGDLTYFLRYHFDVYEKALDALGDYIARKRSEVGDAETALRRWPMLNLRQKLLVRDAFAHADRLYTANGHAGTHDVTHQTAITDLRSLVDHGLLTVTKSGKQNLFRPVADLAARVASGPAR